MNRGQEKNGSCVASNLNQMYVLCKDRSADYGRWGQAGNQNTQAESKAKTPTQLCHTGLSISIPKIPK